MSIVEVVRKTTTVVEVGHPGVQGPPGTDGAQGPTGATVPQSVTTTNATPTVLTTDGGAAGATTTWTLPNNRAACFFGYITARNTSTGEMIAWEVKGAFKRGANAAATALVGTPTVTVIANDAAMAACALAVGVNTTTGSLQLTATGLAATTIAWHGFLNGPENG